VLLFIILLPGLWTTLKLAKTKHCAYWAPTIFKDALTGRYSQENSTKHLFFLLCDHWEPGTCEECRQDAAQWLTRFKAISANHHDSQGRNFQYSWFYPIDNFDTEIISYLADASREGFGEIEVHWHHKHTSSDAFEADLQDGLSWFTKVGALISEPGGSPHWAFIHGNWALDNSRIKTMCGISDEISIFRRNGCYSDMTFPALGTSGQPHMINRIYYAKDTPERKSYDTGVVSTVNVETDGLLMLPGPLGLNLKNPLILIEYGALDDSEGSGFSGKLNKPGEYADYFKTDRVHLWNKLGIGVEGRRDWVFVKIHAHGMQHQDVVLGGAMDQMLSSVEEYCQSHCIKLHYITAREACNLVWAAERNLTGDPQQYYDLVVPQPLTRKPNLINNPD